MSVQLNVRLQRWDVVLVQEDFGLWKACICLYVRHYSFIFRIFFLSLEHWVQSRNIAYAGINLKGTILTFIYSHSHLLETLTKLRIDPSSGRNQGPLGLEVSMLLSALLCICHWCIWWRSGGNRLRRSVQSFLSQAAGLTDVPKPTVRRNLIELCHWPKDMPDTVLPGVDQISLLQGSQITHANEHLSLPKDLLLHCTLSSSLPCHSK